MTTQDPKNLTVTLNGIEIPGFSEKEIHLWEKTFWLSKSHLEKTFRTFGSREIVTLGDIRARFPVRVVTGRGEETKVCRVKAIHTTDGDKMLVTIQETFES